jgi:hypothetical protein
VLGITLQLTPLAAPDPHGHASDLNLDERGDPVQMMRPLAPALRRDDSRLLRGLNNCRHERRRGVLGASRGPPRLPPPCEHLLWGKPMPSRNFRNDCARHQRFFDNPGLEISGELASPAHSRNHFQPANLRGLRLKRMAKCRHKPIPNSEISTIADHQPEQKVGSAQRSRLNACAARFAR